MRTLWRRVRKACADAPSLRSLRTGLSTLRASLSGPSCRVLAARHGPPYVTESGRSVQVGLATGIQAFVTALQFRGLLCPGLASLAARGSRPAPGGGVVASRD